MLNRFFKLTENNTSIRKEFIAGFTAFLSIGYLLAITSSMFSTSGVSSVGVFCATAIASGIACLLVGFTSNFPAILAPGMVINALFNFTIIKSMGFSFEAGLAAVIVSSVIFLIIAYFGLTETILDMIPDDLKIGIGVGLGLFLLVLGLQTSKIIVSGPETLLSLGNLFDPIVILFLIGLAINIVFFLQKIPSSIFFALILTIIVGLAFGFMGLGAGDSYIPSLPARLVSSNLNFSLFGSFIHGFGELFSNITNMFAVIFSILFVTFFDTVGIIFPLSIEAGLIDEDGRPKNIDRIFKTQAISGIIAGLLGTSAIIVCAESAVGVEVGGRTGLTAIFAGIFFFLSIFFYPIILSLVTPAVTAPILVLVGLLIMLQIKDVNWDDTAAVFAVFITIIAMTFTFSISLGIAFGFISYALGMISTGRFKEMNWGIRLLTIVFLAYVLFGL